MNINTGANVTVNGRSYRFPTEPTVCVCIDGSEPGYIEQAVASGLAPNFARLMKDGSNLLAQSVIPSFTNPNNLSIITGSPPAVHGIAGNYFFDPVSKQEVMMNDARFLRAPTIMKAFHDAGAKVAVVTAKDKLRTLLGHGLDLSSGRAIAFSSEKADKATLQDNGIADVPQRIGMKVPDVYSSELSEFVMAAGLSIVMCERPNLMYLSTTDYVQHKAAPGSPMANAFYAMMDRYVGALDKQGCVLVLTADHGMNDKHLPNGEPDVIYLQDQIRCLAWQGKGAGHSSHHRSLCCPSRRAGLICNRLSPGRCRYRRQSLTSSARSTASRWRCPAMKPAGALSYHRIGSATSSRYRPFTRCSAPAGRGTT